MHETREVTWPTSVASGPNGIRRAITPCGVHRAEPWVTRSSGCPAREGGACQALRLYLGETRGRREESRSRGINKIKNKGESY